MIRRYDTKPGLKVMVEDCDAPMDLRGLVVEANMWAMGKLKADMANTDTTFSLADNIGFYQIMVGDVIVMDRVRSPEYMVCVGFNEDSYTVTVQRGLYGSTVSNWKKGQRLRILRIFNGRGQSETDFDDIQSVEGRIDKNQLTGSALVYEWQPNDTCLPGCYWFEFKLLKLATTPPGFTETVYSPDGHYIPHVGFTESTYVYTPPSGGPIEFPGDSPDIDQPYGDWGDVYGSYPFAPELHPGETNHEFFEDHYDKSAYYAGVDGHSHFNDKDLHKLRRGGDGMIYDGDNMDKLVVFKDSSTYTEPPFTFPTYGCSLPPGVEWTRRWPVCGEGFLIKIEDTVSQEL